MKLNFLQRLFCKHDYKPGYYICYFKTNECGDVIQTEENHEASQCKICGKVKIHGR